MTAAVMGYYFLRYPERYQKSPAQIPAGHPIWVILASGVSASLVAAYGAIVLVLWLNNMWPL